MALCFHLHLRCTSRSMLHWVKVVLKCVYKAEHSWYRKQQDAINSVLFDLVSCEQTALFKRFAMKSICWKNNTTILYKTNHPNKSKKSTKSQQWSRTLMRCMPSVLYAICAVCHLFCVPSVLYVICVVCHLFCVPSVLYAICSVCDSRKPDLTSAGGAKCCCKNYSEMQIQTNKQSKNSSSSSGSSSIINNKINI